MNAELFDRVRAYKESVAVARSMQNAGLISYKEFLWLENQLAKKYGLNPRSIFRDIT